MQVLRFDFVKPRSIFLADGLVGIVVLGSACGDDVATVQTMPLLVSETPAPMAIETTTTLSENPEFYTIQQGDTLSAIAAAFGVSVQDIVTLNGLTSPDAIQAGQKLSIPGNGVAPTTTSAVTTTGAPGSATTMAP